MILFPALDIKDGQCVRLLKGDFDKATIYNADPLEQAQQFVDYGCEWLHIVDLNGALSGLSVNGSVVEKIVRAANIPVQLGGGIRDLAGIESWLEKGVNRVILGTVAVREPGLVKEACKLFPGRIVVSIDSLNGYVATDGWTDISSRKSLDVALMMEQAGVSAIVFTDIDRDGGLSGLNMEATVDLAYQLGVPVIASGGVASIADIEAVKKEEQAGIEGVICGRAIYDGRIDVVAALEILKKC
ncbi:MAG: 1-(5-phosphoribosyl)-5-[(5-phosphoribosylamino)methylideneamino]imidazole-4-carboxamide isomerase [Alphaproteobacteria bacterium]